MYVSVVALSDKMITFLPNDHKHINNFDYAYDGFEGVGRDIISLEFICIVSRKKRKNKRKKNARNSIPA